VVSQLGDHVKVFFDAGPAKDGPASSIVDLTGRRPRLLREGAIPAEELERVLEEPFDDAS
jgi:L-threonylcarbamoyladenylate synthase